MDNMADKLKSMLDDPTTMSKISAIMENLQPQSGNNQDSAKNVSATSGSPLSQPDIMESVGSLMNQLNSTDDPRINLLNSLKPYMGSIRSAKMDQAIKLIQISKIASAFKL